MKTLGYPARIWKDEEGFYQVEFPDLSGALTYGETLEEAKANAREALTGVLGSILDRSKEVPRPSETKGKEIFAIEPEAEVAVPILLRWARQDAKLTLSDVANRVGVKYQAIQQLESRGANASIKTLTKVAKALGRDLHVVI